MKLSILGCLATELVLLSSLAQSTQSLAAERGNGKDLFERRCSGCHSLDKNKEGPRLSGIYGRAAGTAPGFEYSDALKAARITWDAAKLNQWLADPEQLVPNNDMAFRLVNPDERAAILDYLKAQ